MKDAKSLPISEIEVSDTAPPIPAPIHMVEGASCSTTKSGDLANDTKVGYRHVLASVSASTDNRGSDVRHLSTSELALERRLTCVEIVERRGVSLGEKAISRAFKAEWSPALFERFGPPPSPRSIRRWCQHAGSGLPLAARRPGPRPSNPSWRLVRTAEGTVTVAPTANGELAHAARHPEHRRFGCHGGCCAVGSDTRSTCTRRGVGACLVRVNVPARQLSLEDGDIIRDGDTFHLFRRDPVVEDWPATCTLFSLPDNDNPGAAMEMRQFDLALLHAALASGMISVVPDDEVRRLLPHLERRGAGRGRSHSNAGGMRRAHKRTFGELRRDQVIFSGRELEERIAAGKVKERPKRHR